MSIRLVQDVERAELLEDIWVAEEEIAAGQGVEHHKAKQQLLDRLRRRASAGYSRRPSGPTPLMVSPGDVLNSALRLGDLDGSDIDV